MKKILLCLFGILLFTGCSCTNTTMVSSPTKKVEEFLGKYQNIDTEVLTQLDLIVSEDTTMSDEEKSTYRGLMEKQYQNLAYKIKNEEISDDKAVVEVEIEVLDYASSIRKSKKYYDEHLDEFKEDDTYTKYKLEQMGKVDDKVKYDMSFHLTKSEDGTWSLDSISDVDRQKIHGLYEK